MHKTNTSDACTGGPNVSSSFNPPPQFLFFFRACTNALASSACIYFFISLLNRRRTAIFVQVFRTALDVHRMESSHTDWQCTLSLKFFFFFSQQIYFQPIKRFSVVHVTGSKNQWIFRCIADQLFRGHIRFSVTD